MALFSTNRNTKSFYGCFKNLATRYLQTQTLKAPPSSINVIKLDSNTPQSYTTGLNIKVEDKPGSLKRILEIFEADQIHLTDIQTKFSPLENTLSAFNIYFNDMPSNSKVDKIKNSLETKLSAKVSPITEKKIPWFPQSESDLYLLNAKTLSRQELLGADHPGIHDPQYLQRRDEIAQISNSYTSGPLPFIDYTESENKLWALIFPKLLSLYNGRACSEFLRSLNDFLEVGVYSLDKIPQIAQVSDLVNKKTGFKLRPVTGLLDSRDFLNALAFKQFFATQYLRHPSKPFYTPEPDIIHEYLGHCVLLANHDYAEFTQMIGLASLGASDEQINLLTHLYWYTSEFGLVFDNINLKAYGAGVLSSVEELDFATRPSNKTVKIYQFSPYTASKEPFYMHDIQTVYFAVKSLSDLREKCQEFTEEFLKPFSLKYDSESNSVRLTTSVRPTPAALQL